MQYSTVPSQTETVLHGSRVISGFGGESLPKPPLSLVKVMPPADSWHGVWPGQDGVVIPCMDRYEYGQIPLVSSLISQ